MIYYDAEMEKGAVGIRPLERGNDQQLLAEALRTAAVPMCVAAVGECAEMSGESPFPCLIWKSLTLSRTY